MKNMPTTATWAYQGRVITSIKDMPEGTYGFIYEVRYKPTGIRPLRPCLALSSFKTKSSN